MDMRARPALIAAAVACAALAAACGQARASHVAQAHTRMVAVHLPPGRTPTISGGSAPERALLRRIVRAMRPTQIESLTIAPASPQWHPVRPGDVELMATVTPGPHPHDNPLGQWETWIVGGAFRDRSSALRLPRVLVVGDGEGVMRATGGQHPQGQPPSGLTRFRHRVAAAAAASGARVVALRAGVPDGYSADMALQVADPVAFLQHRIGALQERLQRLDADGVFVALYEADGRPLYTGGESSRLTAGVGGVADPRYQSCGPSTLGGGLSLAPPLPCPSDWRPPASTPAKPPKLDGWEGGGTANGDWNGRAGITVAYRPGATGGLGFVLANPNGHPIVVESIAPAVPAGAPIRYTGARIQVPPSRARPGTAAEFGKPYGPEPAFAPVTIRPGDWIGVSLHFAVARACTAATAARTFQVDRTFVLTYRLRGETIRHRYTSVPLNLTCPAVATGSG